MTPRRLPDEEVERLTRRDADAPTPSDIEPAHRLIGRAVGLGACSS